VQAAEAAGIPVAELVKQNAAQFIALRTNLNLFLRRLHPDQRRRAPSTWRRTTLEGVHREG
jgi:hypothetical protein